MVGKSACFLLFIAIIIIKRIVTLIYIGLSGRGTKPTTGERRAIYTLGGVIYFDHMMQKYRSIT